MLTKMSEKKYLQSSYFTTGYALLREIKIFIISNTLEYLVHVKAN